jgi:16S rRNA (cytosine1402-N4)-methyltransferase
MSTAHQPVLYKEIIHFLKPADRGFYVDGTIGAGGHAFGILEYSSPQGKLLGLDLDPIALKLASQRLESYGDRVILRQASYETLIEHLAELKWQSVNGILVDLGVSSMQVDQAERGFSFSKEAPLDMRFNPDNPITAQQLVNGLTEQELANIIYQFGEERNSRKIAKAIVKARPIHTTTQLAQVVASITRSGKPGIHPATRTFQALRIAVNNELDTLQSFLPKAVKALSPGGRLAVISFHSLEDRIVKQFFRQESIDCLCPPKQPICTCGHKAALKILTRKPIEPKDEEIARNPRSRSARLRVAQKLILA